MKNLKKTSIILSILSFLTLFTSANAEIKVVASIKPIHSLASYLMDGVAKPDLIVDGYASPHGFAMKPSHAKMLQNADIVFWVGEDLENFLEKPLNSIATKAEKIELMEIKKLTKLKFRERNIFDDHDDHDHDEHAKKDDHDDHDHDEHAKKDDHDDHDHDEHAKKDDHDDHDHDEHAKKDDHDDHDHDEHAKKDDHDDHDHDEHAKKDDHDDHDDHDGHEGHHHGEFDPHIWLDPMNAKVILNEMAEHLIENDAKNASKYKSNLKKALKDIDKLVSNVSSELNQSVASIVFHDAYQYFEKRFDVNILGAFTVNTDVMPGAEQLAEIREIIEHDKVACVFSEPQFNPDIIKAVAKDMNIKTGVVDPLGATLNPGKDLYFDLIKNMSNSFKGC
jgi:zinc transport system substrate-binding protein